MYVDCHKISQLLQEVFFVAGVDFCGWPWWFVVLLGFSVCLVVVVFFFFNK